MSGCCVLVVDETRMTQKEESLVVVDGVRVTYPFASEKWQWLHGVSRVVGMEMG